MNAPSERPKVFMTTYGCQMNVLDTELVRGQLEALGYGFTDTVGDAGVVLINTCSVRELSEQKVWSQLGRLAIQKKQENPDLVVGVLGCMAEREAQGIFQRMPHVDLVCGPSMLDKVPSLVDNAVNNSAERQVALTGHVARRSAVLDAAKDGIESLDLSRAFSPIESKFQAYARITRGCNKFCTYCVVPFTRGAEVHRPPDHIIDECERLADAGVVEITLLGQTVNHYRFEHGAAASVIGITQPQKGRTYKGSHHRDALAGTSTTTFADLLARIHDEVPAIQRLRFVTSYPRDFGNAVLEVIRLLGYRKVQGSALNLPAAEDWSEPPTAPAAVRPEGFERRLRDAA